ncbi:MAG: hydroxymethylglutaryl-CoA lyase [Steroidobacterales bacterium]
MAYPSQVLLIEVGMRDGFQAEAQVLSTDAKAGVGLALIAAGIRRLEATAFVSTRAVPQLADAAELVALLKGHGAELSAFVSNVNGAWRAVAAGIDRMTVSVSASETHNLKNVRRTIAASLESLAHIGRIAADAGVALGASVSTAFGCPYEGDVSADAVLRVVDGFIAVGASEISLGDTTGMATPPIVAALLARVRERHPQVPLALHLHNARGLGLVNVVTGLQLGVERFESSIGGLGGCPAGAGTSGNVCTEDLAYLLGELGIQSNVDLPKLIAVAGSVQALIGRSLPGQLIKAGPRLQRPTPQG